MENINNFISNHNFFAFPQRAILDKRLKGTDICVLVALFSLINPWSEIDINLSQIAERAKIEPKLAHKGINRLKKFGWLTITDNKYILNIPESLD